MTRAAASIGELKPIKQERHDMARASTRPQRDCGPFKCSRCESEFRSRRNRRRHGKREHRDAAHGETVKAEIAMSEFSATSLKMLAAIKKAGDAAAQKQGTSGTKEQGKPKAQVQGKTKTPVQGKPKIQGQSKPGAQEKPKAKNQKMGELKIQKKSVSETKKTGKPVKPRKSTISRATERRIPKDVNMGSMEVTEQLEKMYGNRQPGMSAVDAKTRMNLAINLAKQIKDRANPEKNRDKKSVLKGRLQQKQENSVMLRQLSGESSKAMEFLGCDESN